MPARLQQQRGQTVCSHAKGSEFQTQDCSRRLLKVCDEGGFDSLFVASQACLLGKGYRAFTQLHTQRGSAGPEHQKLLLVCTTGSRPAFPSRKRPLFASDKSCFETFCQAWWSISEAAAEIVAPAPEIQWSIHSIVDLRSNCSGYQHRGYFLLIHNTQLKHTSAVDLRSYQGQLISSVVQPASCDRLQGQLHHNISHCYTCQDHAEILTHD